MEISPANIVKIFNFIKQTDNCSLDNLKDFVYPDHKQYEDKVLLVESRGCTVSVTALIDKTKYTELKSQKPWAFDFERYGIPRKLAFSDLIAINDPCGIDSFLQYRERDHDFETFFNNQ